ncbi:hypothetical protein ACFYZI_03715 [Streptomyces griseorubiginosus]|uniref:hypothetical protein n=1 Tax=Streptomyces griseorubiginosus TaxID=67304 RepID=UPI0036A8AEAE
MTGVDRSPEMIRQACEEAPANAYNRTALDWMISGCGLPVSLLLRWLRGGRRAPVGMPMEDSAMHWGEVRRGARSLLPGCRYRRRLLWRYTAVWDKPEEGGP